MKILFSKNNVVKIKQSYTTDKEFDFFRKKEKARERGGMEWVKCS